jgi:bifunctional DNA-binding transcriptional regulator/antitoxin component of YhaV-PrlF toxin-antitoxin module
MAAKVICFVTESLDEGPAFAVRADNDQQVYIPRSIAEELELEEFDEIEAIVARNTVQPEKTPWYALKARRLGAAPAEG